MTLGKSELRAQLRAARARRPPEELRACGTALAREAGEVIDGLGVGDCVAAFLSTAAEPATGPLLEMLGHKGLRILLPVPLTRRRLGWALWSGQSEPHVRLPVDVPTGPLLGEGPQALLALSARILFLPALAVDRCGRRLGQGGGFYDQLLAELPATVLRVAVVFADEILAVVPADPHDQPVHAALTTRGISWFTARADGPPDPR